MTKKNSGSFTGGLSQSLGDGGADTIFPTSSVQYTSSGTAPITSLSSSTRHDIHSVLSSPPAPSQSTTASGTFMYSTRSNSTGPVSDIHDHVGSPPLTRTTSSAPSLIDPTTLYPHRVILPDQSFPGLHRNWDPPIDSGEQSYTGTGRLKGRKALITGGDSGIGRAVAIAYAREGADVTINYLPEEQPDADEVQALVEEAGVRFFAMPGDLRNESFCGDLVHRAHEAMGGLDILVSNAGYFVQHFNISTLTTEQILQTFEVNVFASFYLVRAAAPLLPPGSSIIFTSSGMARRPHGAAVDYAATKAALSSMAQTLGLQLGPQGIRVNAVAPGLTATNFLTSHGLTTENADTIAAQLPMGRIAQPAELAPIYVTIAEGRSSQSIASTYGVNGGNLSF